MFDRNIKHKSPMRLRSTCLLVAFCIAIAVLMANDGLPALMRRAVLAGKRRAEELAG